MATTQANGNNPQIEHAEAVMRQLQAGKHPSQAPAVPEPALTPASATVLSLMAALSDRCRNMADTMVTAADDDRKEAYDFSNHLLDLARRWGDALLKRKRQELAELEAFLGNPRLREDKGGK